MIKNIAALLATVSLGIISLGAAACGDDGASTGSLPTSATSASAPTSTAPTSAAPTPSSTPNSSKPPSTPDERPTVTGSQVIMIDPDGKTYSRKEMVQMAAGMAAAFEGKGLPSDFCAMSYQQGVEEGGKFPAGRAAFMEACQEGVRLAG
ncbi:hypothetical protein [Actinomadura sp. 9N407]|uniref:hypothetical protein n=1 Tax=Actinomadura sp. 9N407 TaxID=3375154 RepID=UPI0037A7C156